MTRSISRRHRLFHLGHNSIWELPDSNLDQMEKIDQSVVEHELGMEEADG